MPVGSAAAADIAAAITGYRAANEGLISSFDELTRIEGIGAETAQYLEARAYLGSFTIRRVDYVGPRVGRELAEKAYLAMVFALVGMLVYITVRFRNLGYALGGILALVHDGIIAAGIFNLWGGQFDLTIVAAILTLLGYSINDTIVIFDRVRENLRRSNREDFIGILNTSINETLPRTVLTSGTSFAVLLALAVLGGSVVHPFALVMLFGIVVGTYSSIFIASPVLLAIERRWPGAQVRGVKSKEAASPHQRKRPQPVG